jgi:ribosome-binding factor A
MKSMTPRQHKVANEVQHVVAMALVQGRVASTLPLSRVSVVDSWISPDLRLARMFLLVPPELNTPQFFADMNAQVAKPLRKILGEKLATKYTPDVTFYPAEDGKSYPAPTKALMK